MKNVKQILTNKLQANHYLNIVSNSNLSTKQNEPILDNVCKYICIPYTHI